MRANVKNRDLLKSKFLFVTNNASFAIHARKFCIENGIYSDKDSAPIISVRTLSALLFLTLGNEIDRNTLSHKQLLYSCGRALVAQPDLMAAFNQRMQELSSGKNEHIQAIILEPRTLQIVMDQAWGDPDVITPDNFDSILKKAREEMFVEQKAEHRAEVQKISIDLEKLANQNSDLQNSILIALNKAAIRSTREVRTVVIVIKAVLMMCVLLGTASLFMDIHWALVSMAAIGATVFGVSNIYPVSTNQWVSKKLQHCTETRFQQHIQNLGLPFKPEQYTFDWRVGVVKENHIADKP